MVVAGFVMLWLAFTIHAVLVFWEACGISVVVVLLRMAACVLSFLDAVMLAFHFKMSLFWRGRCI